MQRHFDLYVLRNMGEINQVALSTLYNLRKSFFLCVFLPLYLLGAFCSLFILEEHTWSSFWDNYFFWVYPTLMVWSLCITAGVVVMVRHFQRKTEQVPRHGSQSLYLIKQGMSDVLSLLFHAVFILGLSFVPVLNILAPVVMLSLIIHFLRSGKKNALQAMSMAFASLKHHGHILGSLLLLEFILLVNVCILGFVFWGAFTLLGSNFFLSAEIEWLTHQEFFNDLLFWGGLLIAQLLLSFWSMALVFFGGHLIEYQEQSKLFARIQAF